MFVLSCNITVGSARFTAVNEIEIKRSIFDLAATTTIKIPATAVINQSGMPKTAIETAQKIKIGDPVAIDLGYNGALKREFTGYVKRVNYSIPLEIECEDEYYRTRATNIAKSFKKTTLKQVLNAVLEPLNIAFRCGVELTIDKLTIDNISVAALLGKLKTDYGLDMFFDLDGRLLVLRSYQGSTGEVIKYRFRYNVIQDDELKFQLKTEVKLSIKAICYMKDGSKVEATLGDENGSQKTLYVYDINSSSELKALAQRELERYSYDGYTGTIETFLEPYAAPCMVAEISDPVYPDRDGNYYIETVKVTFGQSGARRSIDIGVKM